MVRPGRKFDDNVDAVTYYVFMFPFPSRDMDPCNYVQIMLITPVHVLNFPLMKIAVLSPNPEMIY